MKKILLISFVIGFVFNCNAQQFSCKMKFVDAVGHIDSLILGYDATATDSIDPAFGETNIITTPFTSGIDVRAGNVWFVQNHTTFSGKIPFETKKQILPNNCGTGTFWSVGPIAEINVVSTSFPIKAYWDKSLFNDSCRYGSVFTDMNPGCWWDCGGFRTILSSIDSTVFNRSQYFYLKGADTVFVYWAAFSDSSLLKLGIENKENVASSLRVFPNPAMNHLSVEFPKVLMIKSGQGRYSSSKEYYQWKSTLFEVYDLQGKKVFEKEIPKVQQQLELDISDWQRGMYYFRLVYDKQTVDGVKVIIN
jgi:hypothetical protein